MMQRRRTWPGVPIAALAFVLAACGGGGGDPAAPAATPTCALASQWNGSACEAFAQRSAERIPTPWTEGGQPVTLELLVYRPLGDPPAGQRWPAVVIHHGSTGSGTDPSQFRLSFESQTLAREFTARGWLVLFPQRRGRGQSDGTYDEGFGADRAAGYSCLQGPALAGWSRALDDAAAIGEHVRGRADVDPARLLLAGVSRGGALALGHAAASPGRYRGVVNFVGGWLGEGCVDAVPVNRQTLAAGLPDRDTLWLYGENDPFYGPAHSRANFDAFVGAGGQGRWSLLRRADPAASGHNVHQEPSLWRALVDSYLRDLGL